MHFKDYLVVVLLSAAVGFLGGGAAAHTKITTGQDPEVTQRELAPVRSRVQRLEETWETFGQPRLADLEAGLSRLEARVAALEGAPIREGAPAPEAWTEADVQALRVGLEKVRQAEQQDRDAQRLRQVVQGIVPDAEPAVRDETVARLLEAIRAVREDPAQAEALRAALLEELLRSYPESIAQRLARLVPAGEGAEGAR